LWQLWMERPDGGSGGENGAAETIASASLAAQCRAGACSPEDIGQLVVTMIRDKPTVLVDDAQAVAYGAAAGAAEISSSTIRAVLIALLDVGIAPRPRETVIRAVASSGGHAEDAFEAAFAALQGRQV